LNMRGLAAPPVRIVGFDELDEVLRGIRDELVRQTELFEQTGDPAAYSKAHQLMGTLAATGDESARRGYEHLQRTVRSGSRFAAEGADPQLLDALAAGGHAQVVRGQPGSVAGPPVRPGGQREGLGLAGVMGKALAEATPSAGGYLVPAEVSDEILKMLRARSAVMQMGVRVVQVKKSLAITALSTGAAAGYVAENAPIPISEQTFDQDVLLAPKELAALVPVSNRLLRDAAENPDVEQVVRSDLAEVLALRADLAFLRGTGSAGEPLGITNSSGLTAAPSLGTNGATPSYDNLKDTVAALRALNAPFNRPGWVFNPRLLSTLEKLKDGQNRYLQEAGLLEFNTTGASGKLLGYPFVTTTQLPVNLTRGSSTDATEVIFSSDWDEAWVGEEQGLAIDASGEANYWDGAQWVSAFQNRQTLFRAVTAHDIGLRRPQLFTVLTGVRP
jgi:HK97 family phage major capsid protein